MSITDELREYVWQHATNNDELRAIADRIDAEHKKSVMDALNDALFHANEDDMAELGWVRLPKDADGVPDGFLLLLWMLDGNAEARDELRRRRNNEEASKSHPRDGGIHPRGVAAGAQAQDHEPRGVRGRERGSHSEACEGRAVSEELKSCPWCESTHGIHFEGRPTLLGTEWRLVHSTERCPMRVETEWYRSRDEAVDAWNRRADA